MGFAASRQIKGKFSMNAPNGTSDSVAKNAKPVRGLGSEDKRSKLAKFNDKLWKLTDQDSRFRSVNRTVITLLIAALGFGLHEGWSYVRDKYIAGPDDFLVDMRKESQSNFDKLQDSISKLTSGNVDGNTIEEVKSAARKIQADNQKLISQVALAQKENERLSDLRNGAGIRGGYDFVLSANSGIRLAEGVNFGTQAMYKDGSYATLNVVGQEPQHKYMKSGEAIAYKNAAGQNCQIALLTQTIEAATFTHTCK